MELPIKLLQDHNLWEILREPSIARWREKADWIAANHGRIKVIVHPDYVLSNERLALSQQFLVYLKPLRGGGHAQPCDIAAWWRSEDVSDVAAIVAALLGGSRFGVIGALVAARLSRSS